MPSRAWTIIAVLIAVAAGALAFYLFLPFPPPPPTPSMPTTRLAPPDLRGRTMGGEWAVRTTAPLDPATTARLAAEIQALLDRIEGQLSTWKPDSTLSRFNAHRGTDWFAVEPVLAAVVAEAQRIAADTGGAFDVTVGPLVNLWGFGPMTQPATTNPVRRIPADAEVAAAKQHVGFRLLEVRAGPPAIRKLDPDAYVDLSAIGQGFAADRVAAHLDAAGVTGYLVDVLGEVRARGQSRRGGPWRVSLQAPVPGDEVAFRGVLLTDTAMAVSGDYRNYFEAGGKRYSHEIDLRTGRPADNAAASVAVAHPSAATADALATALMVLGPDAGYDYAVQRDLAVVFIVRAGDRFELKPTPKFRPLLVTPVTGPATRP